jgi:dTDP-4-amino-4,6-dideoxygalactose transaminase
MIKYPINEPNLSGLEKKYVQDVIDSNWLSGGGKYNVIMC